MKTTSRLIFLGFWAFVAAIYSFPTFFGDCSLCDALGARPVPLGLDLRGGASVLLEVDLNSANKNLLQRMAISSRRFLREAKITVKSVTVQGDALHINAPQDAIETVRRSVGRDVAVEYDSSQNVFVAQPEEAFLLAQQSLLIEQSLDVVSRRIDESGTKEAQVLRQGFNRILVQVPGVDSTEHLLSLLGRTAQLNFHLMAQQEFGALKVPGQQKGSVYSLQPLPSVTGDNLLDAQPSFDNDGQPAVSFRLNSIGARKFGEVTSKNVGKPFAIVLDKKVISAPVIQTAITGGSGIISGNFTPAEARQLAILLRSGALPADLTVLEESTVGPDLGSDSIHLGKIATYVSIAFLFFFVWVMYGGLFGTVANISLVFNITLLISLMSLLETTLTLPGVAGMALTLGMAVDANVLIYERIKEEIASGTSLGESLKMGFSRAITTIVDSNVTTLLGAFFLYQFGSGAVRGFAVSLSLGILLSMFTAITLTRSLLHIALRKKLC